MDRFFLPPERSKIPMDAARIEPAQQAAALSTRPWPNGILNNYEQILKVN